jgi:hypothetical protein
MKNISIISTATMNLFFMMALKKHWLNSSNIQIYFHSYESARVGKGLMTEEDLLDLHTKMNADILNAGEEELMEFTYCTLSPMMIRKENPTRVWPSGPKPISRILILENQS